MIKIQLRGLNKMIFDRFFKAKHLNSDPEIRQQAINNLSLDKASDKQALHELAFNDSSADVSLAALEKLNSFPLWLKASETAEIARVRKLSNEKILQEVSKPNSSLLSQKEFDAFVTESTNAFLLEQILFNNQRLQSNDALALAVLLKLNKTSINRRFFKDHADQAQQLVIVSRTDDSAELGKLIKVCSNDLVLAALEDKAAHLKALAALPIKIKQDATLVISKLLALKDGNDYEQIYENKKLLCQKFEEYKVDFRLLDEDTSLLLAEKYLRVNESVDKRLLVLKEDWLSANELKQTTNALAEIDDRFKEVKQQIDAILASIDDPSLLAQAKLLGNALADIRLDLEDSEKRPQTVAHVRSIKALAASLNTYEGFLQQLPAAREKHSQAQTLLVQLQGLDEGLTTEALSTALKELQSQWKSLQVNSLLPLPADLVAVWRGSEKKHKSKISLVQEGLKQQEKKVLSKLKTVQRMVDQGSFKPALAIFKSVQKMYAELPEKGKNGLSKLYTELDEKATELKELQAFIVGPRKPALLEQVVILISETAVKDIPERAQKIKSLRSEWNELGKLGTSDDDALNKQFDDLLEKAFQPCREHYAEQDKIRAGNAEVAQSLVDEMKLLSSHENIASLGRALSAVNKKWRAVGNLEQGERRKLHKGYQKALKPIQLSLDTFYADNLSQKQALLKKAEQLDAIEDLQSASESAKQYQQQWKSIGYSGKLSDEELWLAFRKANDLVFSKINKKRGAEASELAEVKAQFKKLSEQIKEQLSQVSEMKELAELDENIEALAEVFNNIPNRQEKFEQQQLEAIRVQRKAKHSEFEKLKTLVQWQNLFDTLAKWQQAEMPEGIDEVANKYKQLIQLANNSRSDSSSDSSDASQRKALTIKAEILKELPSNKSDESERKKLQLELMAARLEGSDLPTISDILVDWISCGPLAKTDQALLKRLKKTVLI